MSGTYTNQLSNLIREMYKNQRDGMLSTDGFSVKCPKKTNAMTQIFMLISLNPTSLV